MISESKDLLLAFYGDDFTGSTDALEFLSRTGARTILFMEPPTPQQIIRYNDLDAIGVAGMSRTMTPEEMETELRPAFAALQKLNVRHIHYKVCSTFDSSPAIGSIGRAMEIGADIFSSKFIPLLVAAPALGRYCVFGNLFARMGIGSEGAIHRLDRHPSMMHHPVTPMDESDLRQHLSRQTSKKIGLIDILQVKRDRRASQQILDEMANNGPDVILFDALEEEDLDTVGRLLDKYADKKNILFSVGSSGIEMALGKHWANHGKLTARKSWEAPDPADSILVASGSRSPVTSKQIAWALAHGFKEVALDTDTIANEGDPSSVVNKHVVKTVEWLKEGSSVILHTSYGDEDQRIKNAREIFKKQGLDQIASRKKAAVLFGSALGQIIKKITELTSIKRVVFAGGDTSSIAARELDIEAVEMIAPLSPGAPLCRTFAPGSPVDGLEVNFKGGQVGRPDYFDVALKGKYVSY